MSSTELRWAANPPHLAAGDCYPRCTIDDRSGNASVTGPWDHRVVVYAPTEEEARALAQRVADLLNAHEELHHGIN